MKKTLAKTMRSVLALLLVSCLLFGMCGTVLAAEAAGDDCTFNEKVDALYDELADLLLKYGPKVVSTTLDGFDALMETTQALIEALEANGVTCTKLKSAVANAVKKISANVSEEDVIEALNEVKAAVVELGEEVKGNEELMALYAKLKVEIENAISLIILAYESAISADYKANKDSYYVAIGDDTAVSESYVDLVAEELNIVGYKNLAQDSLLVENALSVVEEHADKIAKADLVTVGFGNNTFIKKTLEKVVFGNEVDLNWEAFVGADGEAAVEAVLAKMNEVFVEAGMDFDIYGTMTAAEAMTAAVAAYAYNCLSYAFNLPCLLEKISDINPDALVVIVSMYNPLEDVTFVMDGKSIKVGAFVEGLVEATGLYSLGYAMMHKNVIFVEAEEVEVINIYNEMNLMEVFGAYSAGYMKPSEDGHEYIKDQIIDALNGKARGIWGDVNSDGLVNTIDAMLVLRYYVGFIGAGDLDLDVADVNGDCLINTIDSMLILRHYVGFITKFPVEN